MMAKKRVVIPPKIRDAVLGEFNHRCAICGTDKPHLHHIDEDPSNNDPLNLLPLCPNCHLIDQHNPTARLDPVKLSLFRTYKNPTILTPEFEPLFRRLRFLDRIEDTSEIKKLESQVGELCGFVRALEMGAFYGKQIEKLTEPPKRVYTVRLGGPDQSMQPRSGDINRSTGNNCDRLATKSMIWLSSFCVISGGNLPARKCSGKLPPT